MQPLTARRWALLVDMAKCSEKPDCTKCMEACHKAHNVPEFPDRAHEVKWIWKAPVESLFPAQQNEYLLERFKCNAILALCNHCDQPP